MNPLFDHEKLRVYQHAMSFIVWCGLLFERLPKTLSAVGQLDRASTSVPLNIAEGNGKFTAADRCKYFDIARGSALECAACLDVSIAKRPLTADEVLPGKQSLANIVSMLVGLIKSTSETRLFEDSPDCEERAAD
jgi:four helix bundle protein